MDSAALNSLLKSQPALWRGRDRYAPQPSIPTGFNALDNALPAQGWNIGGVTELLVAQHGIGELSLLLPGLRHVIGHNNSSPSGTGAWAAFVNPPHVPYAPAFSNAGIALERLLIINSADDTNTLWATEQLLRSGLFGAVVAWVNKSCAQRQRRLQLAAETGGSWAAVYRPLHARTEHSPVSTRICISMQLQKDLQSTISPLSSSPPPFNSHTSQQNNPQNNPQLTLDIIKVRAGSPQSITIKPEEFDASQGAEWPVPKTLSTLHDINSQPAVTLKGVRQNTSACHASGVASHSKP